MHILLSFILLFKTVVKGTSKSIQHASSDWTENQENSVYFYLLSNIMKKKQEPVKSSILKLESQVPAKNCRLTLDFQIGVIIYLLAVVMKHRVLSQDLLHRQNYNFQPDYIFKRLSMSFKHQQLKRKQTKSIQLTAINTKQQEVVK